MKAPEICNSNKRRLQCRCFHVNFVKFLRITFLQNTSGRLLLDFFIHLQLNCFLPSNELIKTKFFYIFEHVLSDLSNVMDIMSFAFGKLYFAKQTTHRSSRSHMFSKTRALKNVTNSTGKRLRWSRFLITLEALHDSEHLGGYFLTQLLLYRKTHFSETLRDSTWN